MKKTLLLCALLCASCTPTAVYTKADRATFDAIAPEYRDYVLGDASLDQGARDIRLLNVESWRKRIEAAEVKR